MSDLRRSLGGVLVAVLLAAGGFGPAVAQPPLEQRGEADMASLRQRAGAGQAEAQYELGTALMARNDDRSLEEARRVLQQAMRSGHVEAQSAYAGLLMNGAGGARDQAEGRRLLLDAARRNSVGANITLSIAYLSGAGGFTRDPRRAFRPFERGRAR